MVEGGRFGQRRCLSRRARIIGPHYPELPGANSNNLLIDNKFPKIAVSSTGYSDSGRNHHNPLRDNYTVSTVNLYVIWARFCALLDKACVFSMS